MPPLSSLSIKVKASVKHEDIETDKVIIYGVRLKAKAGKLDMDKFIPLGVEEK